MKTCPYCASDVKTKPDSDKADCNFCEMEVTPAIDGKRASQNYIKPVLPEHMELPTAELMNWNTYRLMELLKNLREERREYFNHLRTFKVAGNETDEFKDIEIKTGMEYEKITRKTWAVENILRDRIGYIPNRITQNLLDKTVQRMDQERNIKPMVISRANKEKEREPPSKEPSIER